tara:strand:- start:34 stop:543 length:510 start_codon:yes stop_codon:yes gene_type:complete
MRVTKLSAATRQLDSAITMLFGDGDLVSVYTLAGAASTIASDLIDPDRSWDLAIQQDNGLTKKEYFAILRKGQNFLKHAKNDPDSVMELDPNDLISLMFVASLNIGEICSTKSVELSYFQFWYAACRTKEFGPKSELVPFAVDMFGRLDGVPFEQQREVGISKWQSGPP